MEVCNINDKKSFVENFEQFRKFWINLKQKKTEILSSIDELKKELENKKKFKPEELANKKYQIRILEDTLETVEKANNEDQFFESVSEICKKLKAGEILLRKSKIKEEEYVDLIDLMKPKRKKVLKDAQQLPPKTFNQIKVLKTANLFSSKKKKSSIEKTESDIKSDVKYEPKLMIFDQEDEYTIRLKKICDGYDLTTPGVTQKMAEFMNSRFFNTEELQNCPYCDSELETNMGSFPKCLSCGLLDTENGVLVCEKETHQVTGGFYRPNIYFTNTVKNFCDQSKFDILSEAHKNFWEQLLIQLKTKDITDLNKIKPALVEQIIQEMARDKSLCENLNINPTSYYPFVNQICNSLWGQAMLTFDDDVMTFLYNLFPIVGAIWENTISDFSQEDQTSLSADAKLCICYVILKMNEKVIQMCGEIKISDNENLKQKFFQNIIDQFPEQKLDFAMFNKTSQTMKKNIVTPLVKNIRQKKAIKKEIDTVKTVEEKTENLSTESKIESIAPLQKEEDINFDDWL